MKVFDTSDSSKPLELLHRAYTDDLSQAVHKLAKGASQGTLPPPYHRLPTREWVFPNTYCEKRSNLERSPANCRIYDHRRFAAPYTDFRKAE